MSSPLWEQMDQQPRRPVRGLLNADLPTSPGVYALYRDGARTYVGKAGSLRIRVGLSHNSGGASMTNSAMRRNVAEFLGIASASAIKSKAYLPTSDDVVAVRAWLDGCEIAWRECESEPAAVALETAMKREQKPPLTKR